jgi:aspartate-semialdehyde dehydrogenase
MQNVPASSAQHRPVSIGLVGRGLVGSKVLEILQERQTSIGELRVFATPRSVGQIIEWQDHRVSIEDAATADYSGLDLVINTADGNFARDHADRIAGQGPVFIDSSFYWRQDTTVPLLIPTINPQILPAKGKVSGKIAKSNCTTTIGAIALNPLHNAAGLKSLTVSTYQSTSGQGNPGTQEHLAQTKAMISRVDELIHGQQKPYPEFTIFPAGTAFNAAPLAGTMPADDHTTEERKYINETRRIFDLPKLPIDVTCVRVGVFNCHCLSILAEFEQLLPVEKAHEILEGASGIVLHRDDDVPQPIFVAGTDQVHIGRVRQSNHLGEHGLNLWVVGDNLRPGAATNLVDTVELLIKQELI